MSRYGLVGALWGAYAFPWKAIRAHGLDVSLSLYSDLHLRAQPDTRVSCDPSFRASRCRASLLSPRLQDLRQPHLHLRPLVPLGLLTNIFHNDQGMHISTLLPVYMLNYGFRSGV